MSEIKKNLKYTKDHEWVSVDGGIATVGITDFAQSELGDLVYIEIDTLDETLDQEDVLGTIEAVKTVSDLFMPVSGEVLEFNDKLEGEPEAANEDPYGEWIVKIKMSDLSQFDDLLSAEDYLKEIGTGEIVD